MTIEEFIHELLLTLDNPYLAGLLIVFTGTISMTRMILKHRQEVIVFRDYQSSNERNIERLDSRLEQLIERIDKMVNLMIVLAQRIR